jgi:hypothetical protein
MSVLAAVNVSVDRQQKIDVRAACLRRSLLADARVSGARIAARHQLIFVLATRG